MSEGFIYLWRSLVKTAFYKNPKTTHLAVHLMLQVAWKDHEILLGGKKHVVRRGQIVSGRNKLAAETGLSPQEIRTCLLHLKNLDFLTIKSTKAYSIITVLNYEKFQNQPEDYQPRDQPSINQASTKHQPQQNKGNKGNKEHIKIFLSQSVEIQLANHLFDQIRLNNPQAKKPNLQTWASQIDLMLRVDNRTADEIRSVIEWCQRDDFWKCNILSVKKLREKYDQLFVKMRNGGHKPVNRLQAANILACEEFISDERIR